MPESRICQKCGGGGVILVWKFLSDSICCTSRRQTKSPILLVGTALESLSHQVQNAHLIMPVPLMAQFLWSHFAFSGEILENWVICTENDR